MTVTTSWRGRVLVAALIGEVDIADSDGLGEALEEVAQADADGVILDFSGVWFINSIGIRMLLRLAKEVRARCTQARIAAAMPSIRSILETVRLDAVLPIDGTVDESVEKLTAHSADAPSA